jgi:F-type H+-transporting ATPase subunit alpha
MKKVAGTLKLDQAQFRELEAFAKFGSDLDVATQQTIDRGRKNQEMLKQAQYSPAPVAQQVAALYASINGYLDKVPVANVKDFEKTYMEILESQHGETLNKIATGNWNDEVTTVLMAEAKIIMQQYHQE